MALSLVSSVRSYSCPTNRFTGLMAAILVGERNSGHLLPKDVPLGIEAPFRLPLIKNLNKDNYYGNGNAILQLYYCYRTKNRTERVARI